jgi:P-type conjugative transfer protein TrbG
MRTRYGIAALLLSGCILTGQTSPPRTNETKPPVAAKRTPPPAKQQQKPVPPVLQQYDFNAQLGALERVEVPGAAGEVKPVFARTDFTGPKAPDVAPRSDVQLNPTALQAVRMSETWRGGQNTPAAGPDGRVLYAFGGGLPVVVCAPLRVCIVELQAGEKIVGEPQIGDSVRWNISPGLYGNGEQATQMVVLKPQDTGLDTNLLITTDRRAYYLRLVSKAQEYVARVAFRYPEEENSQKWQQHLVDQRVQERELKRDAQLLPAMITADKLNFGYSVAGGNEHIRPRRVYDDGAKTYIQMKPEIQNREAPVLVVIGADGKGEMTNYRVREQTYIAPAGLELHPTPPKTVHVSKRAGLAIGVIVVGLLLAFAYGGYKRQQRVDAATRDAGLSKGVAPATSAGREFIQAIPVPDTPAPRQENSNQLQPPGAVSPTAAAGSARPASPPPGCGYDPRTGQVYRFDPQTGQPCNVTPVQERVVVRQPPASHYSAPPSPQPSAEEQRREAAYQREREAMLAPTGIRSGNGGLSIPGGSLSGMAGSRPDDVSQIAALAGALRRSRSDAGSGAALQKAFSSMGSSGGDTDYDGQNMQTRKEAFLAAARSQKTDDYLRSTRSAQLSTYEIKSGWEIPAVLEQSLNSDLPGELKALVMSNVYDTATGRFLLIPQGSRLIGRYDSRIAYGQDGVQVVWERVIYPDGSSVDINGMVGLDSHGNAGLRDKVDRHYKRLFGFAALTSMFTAAFDLSQRRTYGNNGGLMYPSASDTASAAVGREMSQTGAMVTRRNLNVQPTVKVPVGYKFTVRVNRDILFEAPYEPLQADPQPLAPGERGLRRRTSAAAVYGR